MEGPSNNCFWNIYKADEGKLPSYITSRLHWTFGAQSTGANGWLLVLQDLAPGASGPGVGLLLVGPL